MSWQSRNLFFFLTRNLKRGTSHLMA